MEKKDNKNIKAGVVSGSILSTLGAANLLGVKSLERKWKKDPRRAKIEPALLKEKYGVDVNAMKKAGKLSLGIGSAILGVSVYQHYKNKKKNKDVNPKK